MNFINFINALRKWICWNLGESVFEATIPDLALDEREPLRYRCSQVLSAPASFFEPSESVSRRFVIKNNPIRRLTIFGRFEGVVSSHYKGAVALVTISVTARPTL